MGSVSKYLRGAQIAKYSGAGTAKYLRAQTAKYLRAQSAKYWRGPVWQNTCVSKYSGLDYLKSISAEPIVSKYLRAQNFKILAGPGPTSILQFPVSSYSLSAQFPMNGSGAEMQESEQACQDHLGDKRHAD